LKFLPKYDPWWSKSFRAVDDSWTLEEMSNEMERRSLHVPDNSSKTALLSILKESEALNSMTGTGHPLFGRHYCKILVYRCELQNLLGYKVNLRSDSGGREVKVTLVSAIRSKVTISLHGK
jgi:hypothetical protein